MRVLVVGTVPPPGGVAARELAAIAAARVEAGDHVEVLSPDPRGAAHHVANLGSLMLPFRLALMSPRFDELILRMEPGLPLGEQASRFVRGATMLALGMVFATYSKVTIRLDSPIPLPGGVGGRATTDMWRRATTIVVADESDRARLLAAPGVDAARVEVATPRDKLPAEVTQGWPQATETDLRDQVLARVRRRAGIERASNDARVALGAEGVGPLTSTAFSDNAQMVSGGSPIARAFFGRVAREVLGRVNGQR